MVEFYSSLLIYFDNLGFVGQSAHACTIYDM